MRRLVLSFLVISSLVLVISPLISNHVFAYPAFPAYGAGTEANPYRIDNCDELQWINNDLTADYELVSNIDCSGYSFTQLAYNSMNTFTGVLNGQDHSISDFTGFALFGVTAGATIENINIDGSSTYASVVDTATNTTLHNIHSSMSLSGGIFSGGLVFAMSGTSSLSDSSFTGSISLHDTTPGVDIDIGGLVGVEENPTVSITNSYSDATMNFVELGGATNVGGIVGNGSGSMNNVYSSSTINYGVDTDGELFASGLAGYYSGTITNSFSAETLNGAANLDNGLVSNDIGGTYTNNYFDSYLAGTAGCVGAGTASCAAENITNSDPSYFMNNSTNGPFSDWNFNSTWETTSGYPTLRDIAEFNDPSGIPNTGDSTGDGILDSYQGNVAAVENTQDSSWSTITVPGNTYCSIGNAESVTSSSAAVDTNYSAFGSLYSFNVYCPSPGMTVPVTLVFNNIHSMETGSILRHYNPNTKSYTTVPNVVYGLTVIGGIQDMTATYNVTDGGVLDDDALVNGVIEDPVVLANYSPSPISPSTGFGKPKANDYLEIVAGISLAVAIEVVGYSYYKQRITSRTVRK